MAIGEITQDVGRESSQGFSPFKLLTMLAVVVNRKRRIEVTSALPVNVVMDYWKLRDLSILLLDCFTVNFVKYP